MEDRQNLRARLLTVLIDLDDRLPDDQAAYIHDFVDAGEWALALEQIADVLAEDEIGLREDERAELLALNTRLARGDTRLARGIESPAHSPSAPRSTDSPWQGTLPDTG